MSAPDPIEVTVEVHPDAMLDETLLRAAVARQAGVRAADLRGISLRRRAIDARHGRVRIVASIAAYLGDPPRPLQPASPVELPSLTGAPQVAIVGSGPAGLFCAWGLAQAGIRSVIVERGRPVAARRRDLAALCQRGQLDPESNYCFGEGGAGTFSDGKLYTRAHKRGPVRTVLEALVGYGASPDILVNARPHIGTNKLPGVVTRMREHLAAAGIEVLFSARATEVGRRGAAVAGLELADGRQLDVPAVVLCAGHSASDAVAFAARAGARVSFKPFALGLRIEHPQAFIDRLQFGDLAGHPALGSAAYRLVEAVGAGSVYSFCMCPGGHIVPAATEAGQQVVNGMSPSHRRGRFANSGLVTEIGPEQVAAAGLSPEDPLCGLSYRTRIEAAAYDAGGGGFAAPAQTLADLAAARASSSLPPCSYHRGLRPVRLDELLGPLAAPLRAALAAFERRMPGFVSDRAVAVGVESRTSAPWRIERDPTTLEAHGLAGLYPGGEGAGFAGGIVSAALDGLRIAAAIRGRA